MSIKKIQVTVNDVPIVLDSVKDVCKLLGMKQSNVSKYLSDGGTHKLKPILSCQFTKSEDLFDLDDDLCEGNISKKNFTVDTIKGYLENHPQYKGKFALDEFTSRPMLDGEYIEGDFLVKLIGELSNKFEIATSSKDPKLLDAVKLVCQENTVNPLRNRLESLPEWDGVKRKEEFFIKYLHCDDTPLIRHCTNMIFYNALRRFYNPGCPHDFIYVLQQTGQGGGKSTLIERLSLGYYSTLTKLPTFNDLAAILCSTWFLNFDELSTMKYDMSEMKEFISRRSEKGRLIFDTLPTERKRHNLLFGTTNDEHFLRDYSSDDERRYIIFECHAPVDKDRRTKEWWDKNLTDEYIEQVWAEALAEYHENPINYRYLDVPNEYYEEMREIRLRHKSCGNDSQLLNFVKEVSDEKFRINRKCASTNAPKFAACMREFFRLGCMSQTGGDVNPEPLNMIPVSYMEFYFPGKKENYFEIIMSQNGWELKRNVKFYDGKLKDCFVRTNPIEETKPDTAEAEQILGLGYDV